MQYVPFSSDFPASTYAQWRGLAENSLQGAEFDASLFSQTADGIRIEPLYPKALNRPMLTLRTDEARSWVVAQRVDHPDPASANELVLAELKNGANGLVLVGAETPAARGFGLPSMSIKVLDQTLQGASLDRVLVRLDAGIAAIAAAKGLCDLALQRGLRPDVLDFDFGVDPVGVLARSSGSSFNRNMLDSAATLLSALPGSRVFIADGRPYHEAGGSEGQELACVIATALFYLRAIEEHGQGLDAARHSISFLLVADTDIFLTLAKFRALRLLWARIEKACGLRPAPIRVYAETSWRILTRRDPHLNIVRGTVAAFAAGLGGADALTVLPFTQALGLPNAFARRLARNTQSILRDEARLSDVADPTAGAGAFEALTQAVCAHAWQQFQMIEKAGGMPAALSNGEIQSSIFVMREKRQREIQAGKRMIVGTIGFANSTERLASVLRNTPFDCIDSVGMTTIAPLSSYRDSEPFEYPHNAAEISA
jgi:methylmalonyl-CoA mutase